MTRPIDNQHVIEIKPLPSPRDVKTRLPITDEVVGARISDERCDPPDPAWPGYGTFDRDRGTLLDS